MYVAMQMNQITALSRERALQCRRRLPFMVDLLALMMEAGATFLEALDTVVSENEGHPLAEEFRTALNAIQQGVSRHQAMRDLDERLNDETAHELITAIVHGEELGTPLSQILRSQSDLMRLKRSQWAEKAIAEAQVQMSFPGLLIMVACMIIIIMPFLLRAASVSMF
jgi:tight adherence protein C